MKKIVYNLYKFREDLYLPDAYFVSIDNHNRFSHVQHKAYLHHLTENEDYQLHKSLLELAEKLTPESLENRFISNRKKIKNLNELLSNALTKKTVKKYISLKINEFLHLITTNKLPLCIDLNRNNIAQNYIVAFSDSKLKPLLNFEKNDEGIIYKLQLQENDYISEIYKENVFAICDFPAWIIANNTLYQVENINALLIKPFKHKAEIYIPERMVKTYFEKFILKIAKKVDISAQGFDIIIQDKLLTCKLSCYQNIFSNNYEIIPVMIYQGAEFVWNDKRANKIGIEFEEDKIQIKKIVRNINVEKQYIEKLNDAGLVNISGNSFVVNPESQTGENPNAALEWLIQNYDLLVKKGFEIEKPLIDNKTVKLNIPKLKINRVEKIDWFDVEAIIQIGETFIPFVALKRNIIDKNPFFKLPDGSVFIIPQEWMVKYSELFSFASISGNKFKLEKSQFTILENAGIKTGIVYKVNEKNIRFEIPKSLNATLRPYQLEGVKWLWQLQKNELGACLADDMGLGKTLQTLALLLITKEQKKSETGNTENKIVQLSLFSEIDNQNESSFVNLIVMPASLIYNWMAEIQKFAPSLTYYNYTGIKRNKNTVFLKNQNIILSTYQTVLRDVAILEQLNFDYIILDESQQIKNRKSKIFNAITKLKSKYKLSLSGTPIENSLSDLWSQMQFINSELLGSFKFFEKEFIKPIEKFNNEEKLQQLKKIVSPFLLRRTKKEVEKNLPELLVKVHYSDMSDNQKKLYEKEKSAARNNILKIFDHGEGKYKLEILQVLTRLRQLANHPLLVQKDYNHDSGKFNDIMAYWEEVHKAGHKILIFSSYVKYLDILKKELEKRNTRYSFLHGGLNQKQREQEISNFNQDNSISTFLMSIKAGGTGLNLTAADYVFILDPWWNPTTEEQAIARAHRIGQDKKVIAVKFISHDTLEEKILQLQKRKTRLAEDILSNNEKIKLEKEDVIYLLE